MNKKFILLVSIAILVIGADVIFYYQKHKATDDGGKMFVTTSFYPMYFFAQEIGGNKAEVINITPAGAEPHDYELTGQDIVKIQSSRLLIINGGRLEPWGDKITQELQGSKTTIIVAGQNLTNRQGVDENGKPIIDPHVWLDPILAKKEAEKIAQGFISTDPVNASYYKTNLQKLESDLDQLDQAYRQGFASCRQNSFITSHAAFGYLASEYHLNQIAILGVSPDEEPSGKKLTEISQTVQKNGIKIIFFESLVSPKLSETIAAETGAKTMVLNPIEGLTDTDLSQGKSYLTEMQQNLKNLKIALQCQ